MEGRRKGLWSVEEDRILMDHIKLHGKGKWNHVAKMTGLKRCGKSCRLRWINYLSPSVKRDDFSEEEDDLIIRLHKLLGNRWALIAGRIPGRTDSQVKNHWNTHLSKKIRKCELNKTKKNSTFHNRESLRLKPSISNNTETFIDSREIPQYVNPQCVDDDVESENQRRVMKEVTNIQEIATTSWDGTSFLFLDDYLNFSSPNFFHVLHHDTLDFLL